MFDQLGIVTTIWAKRILSGDRFEHLATQFRDNDFKYIEIRYEDYLRNSAFGSFLQEIERTMSRYSDAHWQRICQAIWHKPASFSPKCGGGVGMALIKPEDRLFFGRIGEFVEQTKGLVLSYAIPHQWLSQPEDVNADNQRIIKAKKLAYLMSQRQARLRLVDLESRGKICPRIATANLNRYRSLLPDYPVLLAVENALQTATFTLQLALQGRVLLTYDEANTYRFDGTRLNDPEAFWDAVKIEHITSVHLKQKTVAGVLSQVGDGWVDFAAIIHCLKERGYKGDLLLENAATNQPLEDAIRSREYLLMLLSQASRNHL